MTIAECRGEERPCRCVAYCLRSHNALAYLRGLDKGETGYKAHPIYYYLVRVLA